MVIAINAYTVNIATLAVLSLVGGNTRRTGFEYPTGRRCGDRDVSAEAVVTAPTRYGSAGFVVIAHILSAPN
ncbi:hypothetical protein [Rhodococcus rhodochrous]|uniref:hypothetical protein n=1 Tax=Rhodococcus rhodochrous TaxID=1829 RepID=UPI001364CFF4|nr:hypothetical protein [Rhodococcus rhodochrous]